MKKSESTKPTQPLLLLLFWLYVAIPLGWGVWSTVKKAMALFN
jgi:hypothetical protein